MQRRYTEIWSEDNIARLKHGDIDAIITSPPYADSIKAQKIDVEKEVERLRKVEEDKVRRGKKWGICSDEALRREAEKKLGYRFNPENIGNLGTETYLEAMLKVYSECWKVLKPAGKMVVVVKNFVRKKKFVPLHEHTIKLCEAVGFKLIDHLLFKLPTTSFWRILQKKQGNWFKDLEYEHVLIFQKDEDGG